MTKRPKRKTKSTPRRSSHRIARPSLRRDEARASGPVPPVEYKVVELSTVDEGALERTLNHYVKLGWSLDCVQFAMRESSRRPAMAFVMFTREGGGQAQASDGDDRERARERLRRLAEAPAANERDRVDIEDRSVEDSQARWLSLETDE